VYFYAEPVFCYISNYPFELVDRILSVQVLDDSVLEKAQQQHPGARKLRARLRRARILDGKKHLLNWRESRFPSGLLPYVVSELEKSGFACSVRYDKSCVPKSLPQRPKKTMLQGVELWDFQLEAVRRMLARRRGIVQLPTGSGKTEVAAAVVKALSEEEVLFLVHRKDLLYQTRERLSYRLGEPVGVIGDSEWEDQYRVTVATVQTLWSRNQRPKAFEILKRVGVVIADECHHATSKSWYALLVCCTAPYRFALSATPLLRDDLASAQLIGVTGPLIMRVSTSWLIEQGYLAKPKVRFLTFKAPELVVKGKKQGAYAKKGGIEELGIVQCKEHHDATVWATLDYVEKGLRTLVLVRRLTHGRELQKRLEDALACEVPFLHGEVSISERSTHKQKFLDGKYKVLIATTIYDEGVDIPNIQAEVLAAGGKSPIRAIQRVGRGLRLVDGKRELLVTDIAASHHAALAQHTLERFNVYKAEPLYELSVEEYQPC